MPPGIVLPAPRVVGSVAVIAPGLLPDPFGIFRLQSAQFLAIMMPFLGGEHGEHPHGQSYPVHIILMNPHCHIHRGHDFNIPFLGIQSDIKLTLVLVPVCQGHEDPLPVLFGGNVDSSAAVLLPVAVGSLRNGKSPWRLRRSLWLCLRLVRFPAFHPVLSHLSAQIAVELFRIHFGCQFLLLPLQLPGQDDGLLVQHGGKGVVHLQQEPEVMLLLLGQTLVPTNQLQHPGFCPGPLAFDVPQRIEHGQVKVHRRQPQLSPQPALRHLILDGVAGIQFGQPSDAAVPLVYIALHLAVIRRNLLQLLHILRAKRALAVLVDGLAYLV